MRAGATHCPPSSSPSPSRSPSPHLPSATASPSSSPHRPLPHLHLHSCPRTRTLTLTSLLTPLRAQMSAARRECGRDQLGQHPSPDARTPHPPSTLARSIIVGVGTLVASLPSCTGCSARRPPATACDPPLSGFFLCSCGSPGRFSHCHRWCVPCLVRRLWCRWFILNKLLLQLATFRKKQR
jgi:hypothetical protein